MGVVVRGGWGGNRTRQCVILSRWTSPRSSQTATGYTRVQSQRRTPQEGLRSRRGSARQATQHDNPNMRGPAGQITTAGSPQMTHQGRPRQIRVDVNASKTRIRQPSTQRSTAAYGK